MSELVRRLDDKIAELTDPHGFERRRLRVYVAGPISSGLFDGVNRGIAAGRKLFLAGLAPFVPHFDAFYFLPDGNWNSYLELDLEYISVCDAVWRLQGESKGADLECKVADELGLPIYFEEFDEYNDLLGYADDLGLAGVRK